MCLETPERGWLGQGGGPLWTVWRAFINLHVRLIKLLLGSDRFRRVCVEHGVHEPLPCTQCCIVADVTDMQLVQPC